MAEQVNLLAFDTSTSACVVALHARNQLFSQVHHQPMQQGRLILPTIDALLAQAAISLQDLDAIAYVAGPGSFTGIRIASSVAQGLSVVLEKPVVALSALAVLAQTAFAAHGWRHLAVAVDARMAHCYWAQYEVNEQGIVVARADDQAIELASYHFPDLSDWYGTGDAWRATGLALCSQLKQPPLATDAVLLPSPQALICLAQAQYESKSGLKSALDALPVYLR